LNRAPRRPFTTRPGRSASGARCALVSTVMPLQTTYASPPQHQRDLRPLPGRIPTDSNPTPQAHEKPRLGPACGHRRPALRVDELDARYGVGLPCSSRPD
jgi:hypothetical protein